MAQKHKIEIFSAGCATCKETIDMVRKIAGPDHEVQFTTCIKKELRAARSNMAFEACRPSWSTASWPGAARAVAPTSTSCGKRYVKA